MKTFGQGGDVKIANEGLFVGNFVGVTKGDLVSSGPVQESDEVSTSMALVLNDMSFLSKFAGESDFGTSFSDSFSL